MALPRPLNDLVLIDPEPVEEYTKQQGYTHVVTPDKFKFGPTDPPRWGKVLAKGSNCRPREVKVGARVMFAKFGWAELVWEKKQYAIVREGDLLAVDYGA